MNGVSDTAFAPEETWYAQAAEYCREAGLLFGTGADRFDPEVSVTRAMLAAVLYRQAGSPDPGAGAPGPPGFCPR